MRSLDVPIQAAKEVAAEHGAVPDRCDVLQDGNTLVLRLSETLVARVVNDPGGPRQGLEWFEREIAVARHLAGHGAPVIPEHPEVPPGPYQHLGFSLNFWKFVEVRDDKPQPEDIGRTLHQCHAVLRSFDRPLPRLAILHETLGVLDSLEPRGVFDPGTMRLLRQSIEEPLEALDALPHQPLHGDAHSGNLLSTTIGLLWTDWEDTFSGPVEWDLASIIWNARILDQDHETADRIIAAYENEGGRFDPAALDLCLVARAAVMSAWYPVLYPDADEERKRKLRFRIDWLREHREASRRI